MVNALSLKLTLRDAFAIHVHRASMTLWGNPVVVYQMPKTGSASIAASLKAVGLKNVFHVHKLAPNDTYPFEYSRKLSKLISEQVTDGKQIKFITCVRDPIARNISDLFQMFKVSQKFRAQGLSFPFTSISAENFDNTQMTVEEIRDLFLSEYPHHDLPLFWLDKQIRENLGIDIYDYPFPRQKGYIHISEGAIDLLVLKLEADDALIESEIARFVDMPDFKLLRTNITSQDRFSYNSLYKEFRKTASIPEEYIERMYDSRLVKHFYAEEEVESMRAMWLSHCSAA